MLLKIRRFFFRTKMITRTAAISFESTSHSPTVMLSALGAIRGKVYYAKNLVFKLFFGHELKGSNCSGMKGKRCLEKDQRMDLIKEATFKKYPVEDQKRSLSMCRKAIDSAIRHCKHFS